jgi:hypothetical protein
MRAARQVFWSGLAIVALFGMSAVPAHAQGKGQGKEKQRYAISSDKAVHVTRTVLVQQGYNVVRTERIGPTYVVYYRPAKKRGKGWGPMQRMVIRTVRERVVFEEADPAVMVDIDIKLKL